MLLKPACPASSIIQGPPLGGPTSVCGALVLDHDEDDDWKRETDEWHLFTLRHDPGTLLGFCCDKYTECVIWQAEKDRIWDERDGLAEIKVAPSAAYEALRGVV